MAKLNIVLVEPEIPQNTGNIARTCAATGASLHLVRPLGFYIDDKKLKRAGLDYWHLLDITYYDDLNDFLEKTKGGRYFLFSTRVLIFIQMPSIPITAILFRKGNQGTARRTFDAVSRKHGQNTYD